LDALRYRRALYKRDHEVEWNQGKVSFRHYEDDDGTKFIECADNGIGMDLEIIRKFLTNVGRSYYRSRDLQHTILVLWRAVLRVDAASPLVRSQRHSPGFSLAICYRKRAIDS
jgi:hypothetical protein